MKTPLEILDPRVAKAALALRSARAELERGEGDGDNPLDRFRDVASRAALEEIDASAPLGAAVRDWVAFLTLERVLWDDRARLEASWNDASVPFEAPGLGASLVSPRALLARVLSDPDPARRLPFADALVRGAIPTGDAARRLADRRKEATRLLGLTPDALEVPCPPADLARVAERLLEVTSSLVERAGRGDDWPSAIARAMGRDASLGWPPRLTVRWLADLFRGSGLTDGLAIDLGPIPAAIGATSFARALGQVGAAVSDASARRARSFSLARAPFDAHRARRAALFAGLAADKAFGARVLELNQGRARDQARAVARALLVSLRLDAARVLCRGALSDPSGAGRFEERSAEALGCPLPQPLFGAVPRLSPGDAARFGGTLLGLRDRLAMVERFDEDWFRNPRAIELLRDEDSAPSLRAITPAMLDEGLASLLTSAGDLG